MKRTLALLVCVVLLLGLCACGAQTGETEPPVSAETTAPPETTDPQDTAAPETTEDIIELIRSYIDKPIEELYAIIGQPESSDYASSCLGDGEDGMLFYEDFIVYTYREGDVETVYDVE